MENYIVCGDHLFFLFFFYFFIFYFNWKKKKKKKRRKGKIRKEKRFHTLSLWSPPTILMLSICSSSSRSSNLSVLVVAGSPDLTSTSLRLPISRFPCATHLLTNGLYFCGWSNLLTKDQTWLHEWKKMSEKNLQTQNTTFQPSSFPKKEKSFKS